MSACKDRTVYNSILITTLCVRLVSFMCLRNLNRLMLSNPQRNMKSLVPINSTSIAVTEEPDRFDWDV